MVYTYDEKSKKVKVAKMPKIVGEDAQRMKRAKVPQSFLDDVMAIKLNITKA